MFLRTSQPTSSRQNWSEERGAYSPGERHGPRREQVAVRRLGGEHALFDLLDELDEIFNLFLHGGIGLVVLGLVGVDRLAAGACRDLWRRHFVLCY